MTGGSTLGIGITMFLRDQFSGPASRIKTEATKMEQEFLRMQEAQLRQQRNMYAGLAMAGAMAIRGMGRMVKKSAEFGYEMEFVSTVTQSTIEEQKRLNGISKTLGRETMFYPQAIAEGMRFMAMAGMSATEVEKNIQGAVALAGATKSELGGKGGAADIMTNVMKQFKVGFEYTNDVADILSYAVTRANTNLFDLGEALKYAGATSMDLNVSLGESTAMVMALGNAGLQGSMAGVAMENSMRYMSRAFSEFGSGPSQKALAELGLTVQDVTDSKGDLLTMTEVMKKFGNAIAGIQGNIQRQAILQNVFGVRGKRAGSLFIRNLQEFEKFSGAISNVKKGYATDILGNMMATLQGHIYKLGSTWQSVWISFTEQIGPTVIAVIKVILKVLSGIERIFNSKIFGGMFATGLAGFLIMKTTAWAYKAVVTGIKLAQHMAGMSAASMAGTTVAGWNSMTVAAQNYARASNMAKMSGYAGVMGMARAGKIPGVAVNKAGRYIAAGSAKGAGRFLSTAGVAAVAAGASRVVGGQVVAKSATRLALGRIAGALGGPWGIAISMVLPALLGGVISAVRNSKQSTEENTKAIEETNRAKTRDEAQYTRMGHMITFQDLNAPAVSVIGQTGMGSTYNSRDDILKQLSDTLNKLIGQPNTQPLNIYIDNELQVSRVVDKKMSKQLQDLL